VGCGEGRFCRMLAERGATTTGIDPTAELINAARGRHPQGTYLLEGAEDLPFGDAAFDLVVSYVTLCDIEDYREAIAEMARVLRPGGRLLVAVHNPFVTAAPNGWRRNERGEREVFPVDHYTFESAARVSWRGIEIVNYHRPLSAYLNAFLRERLVLRQVEEPLPSVEDIAVRPDIADYLRIAYFLVMEWRKP
ncbi:MAG TPA: class I SAM-dependent methyltransferase, partial [Fimbriimonadaceae bacterium]|nr:class I SAM-dependent methyltransferase [Fimbriimonadaceae bacterium]